MKSGSSSTFVPLCSQNMNIKYDIWMSLYGLKKFKK